MSCGQHVYTCTLPLRHSDCLFWSLAWSVVTHLLACMWAWACTPRVCVLNEASVSKLICPRVWHGNWYSCCTAVRRTHAGRQLHGNCHGVMGEVGEEGLGSSESTFCPDPKSGSYSFCLKLQNKNSPPVATKRTQNAVWEDNVNKFSNRWPDYVCRVQRQRQMAIRRTTQSSCYYGN